MFRSKKFSLLMALVFAFTVIFPVGAAFAGDNATYANTSKSNLSRDNDNAQEIGFIKITDIPVSEYVYLTVQLPSDVDFESTPANANAVRYSKDGSSTNETSANLVTADEDTLTAWVDIRDAEDDAYIKILFNDTYGTDVLLKSGCDDEIKVTLDVKGVESGSTLWKDEGLTFTLATIGDRTVTVEADSPKTIKVGDERQLADITIKESNAGTLDAGDKLVFTLPDDIEWDLPSNPFTSGDAGWTDWVDNGSYGLIVDQLSVNADKDELTVRFGGSSSLFADEVTLKLQVKVFPNADEGDVDVEVTEDFDSDGQEIDWDDVTITPAIVGDTDVTVTVDDTSDDEIYPGAFNVKIDDITIKGSSKFEDDSTVILTLPKGFKWYIDDTNNASVLDYADIEGYNGIKTVEGVFDNERSIWITLDDSEDEITFEDLTIAALPDAPLGEIEVELDGTAGASGSVVVGECIAAVDVTATAPNVAVAALDQEAGVITLKETFKKGFDASDEELILTLPTGVSFADDPTVYVNGDEEDCNFDYSSDDEKVTITGFDVSDSKLDTIEIKDVVLDLDTRVAAGDIKVKIGGDLVNRFDDADNNVVKDIVDDYQDDAVTSVVIATAGTAAEVTASFAVGDEGVYVENGRTLVQVNLLTDVLGLQKTWDAATKTAYFIKDGKVVAFPIGQNKIYINGVEVPVDQGAKIINGFTCVTLRGLEMAFGGKLSWDNVTKTATFNFVK